MKYGPGKFEACGNYSLIARYLYDTSDGGNGSCQDLGWYDTFSGSLKGRTVHAIITEDSQGAVDIEFFDSAADLKAREKEYEDAYSLFYEQGDENAYA